MTGLETRATTTRSPPSRTAGGHRGSTRTGCRTARTDPVRSRASAGAADAGAGDALAHLFGRGEGGEELRELVVQPRGGAAHQAALPLLPDADGEVARLGGELDPAV